MSAYAHERLARSIRCASSARAPGKGPILSFTMKGAHAHDVATVIDRSGVAVRAGTHCAMPLLQRFGVTSTCRASFALYNTRDEVDALAEALVRAQNCSLEEGLGMTDSPIAATPPSLAAGQAAFGDVAGGARRAHRRDHRRR